MYLWGKGIQESWIKRKQKQKQKNPVFKTLTKTSQIQFLDLITSLRSI